MTENKYYIFGQDGGKRMATHYKLPFLGEIPLVQSVREAGDGGVPIVMHEDEPVSKAFLELAQSVAQQVALKNAGIEIEEDSIVL